MRELNRLGPRFHGDERLSGYALRSSTRFKKSRVRVTANGVATSVATLPQHTFLL